MKCKECQKEIEYEVIGKYNGKEIINYICDDCFEQLEDDMEE